MGYVRWYVTKLESCLVIISSEQLEPCHGLPCSEAPSTRILSMTTWTACRTKGGEDLQGSLQSQLEPWRKCPAVVATSNCLPCECLTLPSFSGRAATLAGSFDRLDSNLSGPRPPRLRLPKRLSGRPTRYECTSSCQRLCSTTTNSLRTLSQDFILRTSLMLAISDYQGPCGPWPTEASAISSLRRLRNIERSSRFFQEMAQQSPCCQGKM